MSDSVAFDRVGQHGAAEWPRVCWQPTTPSVSMTSTLERWTYWYALASASGPADAEANAYHILSSLPNPAIVQVVYLDEDGVANGALSGAVGLGFSTIDAATVISVAKATTESGTLAIIVGGDGVAFKRALPLLKNLGASSTHVGESGSGQIVKLCNNRISASTTVALGEVLVTGQNAGLSTKMMCDVLTASSAKNHMANSHFPRTIFRETRPTGFSLDFMVKDIDLFLATGSRTEVPMLLSALTTGRCSGSPKTKVWEAAIPAPSWSSTRNSPEYACELTNKVVMATTDLYERETLIGGQWPHGERFSTVARVGNTDDARLAVKAARKAFARWRKPPVRTEGDSMAHRRHAISASVEKLVWRLASETGHAIGARYVGSKDVDKAITTAHALRPAWVQVNRGFEPLPGMPYSGIRKINVDRECSIEGALEGYTGPKNFTFRSAQ